MISLRRVPECHSEQIYNIFQMLLSESCCYKEVQEHRRIRFGFGEMKYVLRRRGNVKIPDPVWQLATIKTNWCIRRGTNVILRREQEGDMDVFERLEVKRLRSITSPSVDMVRFHFNDSIIFEVHGSPGRQSGFYFKTPHGIWLEYHSDIGWSLTEVGLDS